VEPTRKAAVEQDMRDGMAKIKQIVKKIFGRSKMQGLKLLTRDLFVQDSGQALTGEVIIIIVKTLPHIGHQFNLDFLAMFFVHLK
jgi:hypothetical protein